MTLGSSRTSGPQGAPAPPAASAARSPLLRSRLLVAALAGASLVLALVARAATSPAPKLPAPPGSEACADCHEQGSHRAKLKAGEAPNFDAAGLRASPHAGLVCVDCHADLKGDEEFAHSEGKPKLAKVECGSCHKNELAQHLESLHGRAFARGEKLAPTCKSCHGTHNVLRPRDPASPTNTMNIPFLCNGCHREGSPVQSFYHIPQDSILQNYQESIHGEGLFKKGLLTTAVCTSCHTAHHQLPHTDERSSIARKNVARTCQQCHVLIEKVHAKVVKGALWEKAPNQVPACVDCHQPHKIRRVYYTLGMADRDCMLCHARKDLRGSHEGKPASMFVDTNELQHSRHAKVACAQCHTGITPSAMRPCVTVIPKVDCSNCHAEIASVYQRSVHGKLSAKGSPDAPECTDCHGTHGILGHLEVQSRTYARNVPVLCGDCHRTGKKAALRYKGSQTEILEHYEESIHGKGLLKSGLVVTATCADCHTPHGELPAGDPESSVNPRNVVSTCAKCHRGVADLFEESVHSPRMTKTKEKLPTCSDCHTSHSINRADLQNFRLTIMTQCGNCHRDLAESYFETYHGKVSKLGYLKTAKCYDCHGAHDILRVTDPRSRLSRQNIVKTCQSCHPGSNRRFAGYLTHATHHDPRKYPALFFVFWAMTGLLVATFVVAGLHTLAWLPRSLQYRQMLVTTHALESKEHVRRFTKLQRNLHLMVITSFITLALTGMTLKFSYTPWAHVLSRLLGGFEAAGMLHRLGALVTFSYFGIHLFEMNKRKRASGKSWVKFILGPNGMMFGPADGKEFIGSLKWFFGKGPRPAYGRWTYWEKFDYFAVFWGVAVIGLSGLLLWFPTLFTHVIPGWLLNVATIIHSDEALLAVGFIFTVHFFNTHFRPEKFPMDTVVFTGGIPLDEFKTDRPREYEELVASGELEQRLVPAPDPRDVRRWRIFGTIALTLGTVLILLILYSAIFGYR
jgi:cytochrome b subunit of formate dehydrogenase/uncharacterized protein with PIN domain